MTSDYFETFTTHASRIRNTDHFGTIIYYFLDTRHSIRNYGHVGFLGNCCCCCCRRRYYYYYDECVGYFYVYSFFNRNLLSRDINKRRARLVRRLTINIGGGIVPSVRSVCFVYEIDPLRYGSQFPARVSREVKFVYRRVAIPSVWFSERTGNCALAEI